MFFASDIVNRVDEKSGDKKPNGVAINSISWQKGDFSPVTAGIVDELKSFFDVPIPPKDLLQIKICVVS